MIEWIGKVLSTPIERTFVVLLWKFRTSLDMNFRLCLIFLLELFMFIEQQHAQDSGEYFLSYNSEELPSPILKKAINNLVGIRMMCRIHPKNCPGAYRKRNSEIPDSRQEQIPDSLSNRDSDGPVWPLSGILTAIHRLRHHHRFNYDDDSI